MPDYEFSNDEFTAAQIDTGPNEERNWVKSLEAAGWVYRTSIPKHSEGEFNQIKVEIYGRGQYAHDPPFLIEISLGDSGLTLVRCPTELDLLRLLRDWIYPLTAHADRAAWMEKMIEAADCLFDERDGLRCAVEHKARDRAHQREMAERRRAMEAKPWRPSHERPAS